MVLLTSMVDTTQPRLMHLWCTDCLMAWTCSSVSTLIQTFPVGQSENGCSSAFQSPESLMSSVRLMLHPSALSTWLIRAPSTLSELAPAPSLSWIVTSPSASLGVPFSAAVVSLRTACASWLVIIGCAHILPSMSLDFRHLTPTIMFLGSSLST